MKNDLKFVISSYAAQFFLAVTMQMCNFARFLSYF